MQNNAITGLNHFQFLIMHPLSFDIPGTNGEDRNGRNALSEKLPLSIVFIVKVSSMVNNCKSRADMIEFKEVRHMRRVDGLIGFVIVLLFAADQSVAIGASPRKPVNLS